MTQVLLVEDEFALGQSLKMGLEREGFVVSWCQTLAEAESFITYQGAPALALLDLGLPDGDGISLLPLLKHHAPQTRVLIVSARDEVDDRIRGLSLGADDYVNKPFVLSELVARMRAGLRRHNELAQNNVHVGNVSLLIAQRLIQVGQAVHEWPAREYELFLCLAQSFPLAVSRDTLARQIWGKTERSPLVDNMIDVHVARIRKRLELLESSVVVHTVRGIGFCLNVFH
jgi:two-component system, OmpR family, copper resistance phosphate regulon response regulator CusR